jgi:hypothetical protein
MASGTAGTDETSGGSNQHSILSAKVSRALEVRTDTPAMKAALDALAHLPDHQDDLFSVDSRSVRVAIEQDALQQALLLQEQLRSLLDIVTTLRQGVTETAAIAHRVGDAIHTNVMTASATPTEAPKPAVVDSSSTNTEEGGTSATPVSNNESASDDALEQEQQLAVLLSDSFLQRNLARKRVDAVHSFLEKFDLSEEDSRLLDHYAFEDVDSSNVNGMAFLAALERVRLIRKELGRTFGTLDLLHHQREHERDGNRMGASSALRMMETLAQKQERAYERLYHWLQKYLHVHAHEPSVGSPAVPQDEDRFDEALSHPFVRKSLYTLRHVPAFYSHLLELIASSRRAEETRRFLLALTSGYGGLPPIEMRAHDAVVYVGDMLAFCFRAFSVEAVVAKGLLNYKPGEEDEHEQQEAKDDVPLAEEDPEYLVDKPISAAEMLSHSMSGVARPLKSRILQVVANLARRPDDEADEDEDDMDDSLEEEGAVARGRLAQLYEICGLLLFYASALDKAVLKLDNGGSQPTDAAQAILPEEKNPIVVSILECLGEAANAYEASLRVYGAMLEQLNVLTGEPEASLAHAMIVRIVNVRGASPGFAEDMACPPEQQQTLSLDWACDILVEASLPTCKTLDDTVSLKQSISLARNAEMSGDVSSTLDAKVHEKETSLIDLLVDRETADVLDLCGLGTLEMAWKRFQGVRVEGMLMATHSGLAQEEVENAMKEFYHSLYSPPIPSFESTIKDPTLRKLARNNIAAKVCSTYEELYDAINKKDSGGYEDLTFLGHTPAQVKTLFSV